MDRVVIVGSLNMDINFSFPTYSNSRGNNHCYRDEPAWGGKIYNQAVAIARLGGNVEMIGAVGNDENGTLIIEGLKEEKVGIEGLMVKEGTPTGTAIISVAENGWLDDLIVHSGANYQLGKEDIDKNIELISRPDTVYCNWRFLMKMFRLSTP